MSGSFVRYERLDERESPRFLLPISRSGMCMRRNVHTEQKREKERERRKLQNSANATGDKATLVNSSLFPFLVVLSAEQIDRQIERRVCGRRK